MALSAYRVMPSMTRLNGQIMAMRLNYHVINVIEAALQSWASNPDNPEHPEHTPVDPRKSAGNKPTLHWKVSPSATKPCSEPVLANLNCTFAPGQIHAIVGPSGSGKSTLVNTILGLHPPISGEIQVGRVRTIKPHCAKKSL